MLVEIALILVTLCVLAYLYLTWTWKHWESKGVYQIEPSFPFGSFPSFFTKKEHVNETLKKMSDAIKDKNLPFFGFYFFRSPGIVINDLDLIKQILVKDFDTFVDRQSGEFSREFKKSSSRSDQLWSRQLTEASGEEWKNMRTTFTPIFTSGKMKLMLTLMKETCHRLVDNMEKFADKNEEFEVKECLGKYSMDTIASCAFGVDAQSFSNENSPFVKYAKNIFTQDIWDGLKIMIVFLPFGFKILSALNLSITKSTEMEFFYEAIMTTLKQRKESKTRRNDLVDLMLDAIKGDLKNEAGDRDSDQQFEKDGKLNHEVTKKADLDEFSIVATAIVLLVAGYDTTGTTLAYASYQLARNPEIQEKLRNEIEDLVGSDNSEMTYDDIQSMTYLDQIISETLRFHNPIAILNRSPSKDYQIPGHDMVIPKDQMVWINAVGIHFNPKYYETPDEFNPDHFTKEAKTNRNPYAFLPFGQGPRACIGMRFALLEAKLALANMVRKFTLLPSEKTKEPLELDPTSGIAYPKNGLYIKLEKRSS